MERRSNADANIGVAKKVSKLPDRTCTYLHTTFADIYKKAFDEYIAVEETGCRLNSMPFFIFSRTPAS